MNSDIAEELFGNFQIGMKARVIDTDRSTRLKEEVKRLNGAHVVIYDGPMNFESEFGVVPHYFFEMPDGGQW